MKSEQPPEQELEELCALAVAAARAAGTHARDNLLRRSEVNVAAAHDVKLQLDVECQAVAERVIHARFPLHAVLGEEGPAVSATGAPLWVVDPIDGTVNFHHGLPWWCCSVAVQIDGQTLAGAVCAPMLEEMYSARAGAPALCNGRPIHVSGTPRLADALLASGIDKQPDRFEAGLRMFTGLCQSARKVRVLGSAALDICHVAAGALDGYFESGIYLWDIAAGALIVQQAGGRAEIVSHLSGDRLQFAASNGIIHDELLAVVGRD